MKGLFWSEKLLRFLGSYTEDAAAPAVVASPEPEAKKEPYVLTDLDRARARRALVRAGVKPK